jgi:hypothetical protein
MAQAAARVSEQRIDRAQRRLAQISFVAQKNEVALPSGALVIRLDQKRRN